ncbi:MAG: tetratricopeptide repeat protein, partial [candidate division KSB1 bacterium]|nr:tetratricopeptide repeat protein [candidate division KSB1 bacterium]
LAGATPDTETHTAIIDSLQKELEVVELATNSARNAVTAFTDSSFAPELLFQLSEWEVRRAKLLFNIEMESYDVKMRLYERDSTSMPEPDEPVLTYSETLDINRRLLREYPDVPYIDMVRYRSGVCLFETGKTEEALDLLLKVQDSYADTSYLPEIKFRVGECYFDLGQFDTALNAYKDVVRQHPESTFFSMALYKIAWCHYRLNDNAEALSAFFYLLDDIDLLTTTACELLGKTHDELVNETVRYIAINFADYGGITAFLDFTAEKGETTFTPLIIEKMAEVYFERNDYSKSLAINRMLVKRYPLELSAPRGYFNMFKAYEALGDFNRAFQIRLEIVEKYGPLSGWAKIFNSNENQQMIADILSSIDYVIATPYLERADSLYNARNFRDASDTYANYIKAFEKDERVSHAAYYLAESYFEVGEYRKSALAYRYVVINFPDSEMREDAAFNRVVCFDKLIETTNDAAPDTLEWVQGGRFYLVPLANKAERGLVYACRDFCRWFPKTEKSIDVQLKMAHVFMNAGRPALAEQVVRKTLVSIIKNDIGKDKYSRALSFMANTQFKLEKYNRAEKFYSHLIKTEKDSADLIEKSKAMLSSSRYKIAESHKLKGNAFKAALIFEKTAEESSEGEVAGSALYESAVQFEAAGRVERAAINFEKYCNRFPGSDNVDEAFFRAATLREKLSQWHLAAANYKAIYRRHLKTPEGASALFAAGNDYENAESWHHVIDTYSTFVSKCSNDDRVLEAMFKIGFAYEKDGRTRAAAMQYERVVQKHLSLSEKGLFSDDYVAAQSRFRLGELNYADFVDIKLRPPFDVNLKRKQAAFNEMLKDFVEVARYNVAEWTTASFFRIGSAYEEFCSDILASPPPAHMKGAQLTEYWAVIHEKWIQPLRTEALKYYETNEKLAAENNIDNQWTRQSRDKFIKLSRKLALANPNDQEKVKQAAGDHQYDAKAREL